MWLAVWIVPGVALGHHGAAAVVAAAIAVVNAILPPVIAALRLPWTVAVGFLSVLHARPQVRLVRRPVQTD